MMIKKKLLISLILILLVVPLYGKVLQFDPISLGILEEEAQVFIVEGQIYPLYSLQGSLFIPLSYLEKMKLPIRKAEGIYVDYPICEAPEAPSSLNLKEKEVHFSNDTVYIGNLKTFCIEVDEIKLIPFETLSVLWNVEAHKSAYIAQPYWCQMNHLITCDKDHITNISPYALHVDLCHLFWDGITFVEQKETRLLLAGESASKLNPPQDLFYMTTVVLSINDFPTGVQEDDLYGQKNEVLYKSYYSEKRRRHLTKLFPPYKVMGKMKYRVAGFEMNERVEVWRSENREYFIVKDAMGNKVQVPWGSIELEGDPGSLGNKISEEDIQDFVKLNDIESETNYLLWTDIYRQRTYVLKRLGGEWHLDKVFVCSTGKPINTTPTGFFVIEYAIPYIGIDKGYRCKNAMVFFRDYMYHSILFDKSGQYIKSGQYDLGRKASHGCVRLSEADSEWIYKNIPVGTKVWIH